MSEDLRLVAAQTADLLRAACRRAGFDVNVEPELPVMGVPYVSFSASADVVRRMAEALERLTEPRGARAVVIPLPRREVDDPWESAETAVEDLADALGAAGLRLGGLRVSGDCAEGPFRSSAPALVDVGEMSPATARKVAALIRKGVRA